MAAKSSVLTLLGWPEQYYQLHKHKLKSEKGLRPLGAGCARITTGGQCHTGKRNLKFYIKDSSLFPSFTERDSDQTSESF